MKGRKAITLVLSLGLLLIAAALVLLFFNIQEDNEAGKYSNQKLDELTSMMTGNSTPSTATGEEPVVSLTSVQSDEIVDSTPAVTEEMKPKQTADAWISDALNMYLREERTGFSFGYFEKLSEDRALLSEQTSAPGTDDSDDADAEDTPAASLSAEPATTVDQLMRTQPIVIRETDLPATLPPQQSSEPQLTDRPTETELPAETPENSVLETVPAVTPSSQVQTEETVSAEQTASPSPAEDQAADTAVTLQPRQTPTKQADTPIPAAYTNEPGATPGPAVTVTTDLSSVPAPPAETGEDVNAEYLEKGLAQTETPPFETPKPDGTQESEVTALPAQIPSPTPTAKAAATSFSTAVPAIIPALPTKTPDASCAPTKFPQGLETDDIQSLMNTLNELPDSILKPLPQPSAAPTAAATLSAASTPRTKVTPKPVNTPRPRPTSTVPAGGEDSVPIDLNDDSEPEVPVELPVVILSDGYRYIGVLEIPRLGLKLPIMEEWDYKRLKLNPCRYSGAPQTNDLILLAHNYTSHFGRLKELEAGDTVIFTDAAGRVYRYEVAEHEILQPLAVNRLEKTDYPLTLFTCTKGGQTRYTVRCVRTP